MRQSRQTAPGEEMSLSENPFTVLSYVGGPALLTNATGLMLLSTANRFARAVDRCRELVKYLESGEGVRSKAGAAQELLMSHQRVGLLGRAMSRFYLAASMFAFATMTSVAGGILGNYLGGLAFDAVIAFAVLTGAVGFFALVSGSLSLTLESRLATRALDMEAAEAAYAIKIALDPKSDEL
jgi:Protein of unknown function (DUF2721)